MLEHAGLKDFSALECAIVSAGIGTLWKGQFENWDAINSAAAEVQRGLSGESPEKFVENALHWLAAKTAHDFFDEQTILKHLHRSTVLKLVNAKAINTQQIRGQLLLVATRHGRNITSSMILTALARHLRDISKSRFHAEMLRYKDKENICALEK